MPPLQTLTGIVGLAKQTGKGAAAATPTYGIGLLDGQAFNLPIDQEPAPLTLGGAANDRVAPAAQRTGIHPGAGLTTRVWPRTSALLWYAALGTLATVGAAAPYTHTASPAMDLPWLTAWGRLDTERVKMTDAKVNSLTMSWNQREALTFELELMALAAALGAAAFTPTNDETNQTFFGPQAGTFLLDAGSATPVSAKVVGASVHVGNNLNEVPLSNSNLPADLVPGRQEIDGTIRLIPDDMAEWRKAVTGTAGGTAPSEVPINGSFSLKVVIDANTDLVLAASRVPMLAEVPGANPDGGPAELELAFSALRPTGAGDAFTAVTRNAVATY